MSAEVWLGALQLCLQPSVILFLCIGVCIGTVIGALPGLSATMGIAIMTPITFWFEPADGFAMLMGHLCRRYFRNSGQHPRHPCVHYPVL